MADRGVHASATLILLAESGNLWRIMGGVLWSRLDADLRHFHRGGGARYWLRTDNPLPAVAALETVQSRAALDHGVDSLAVAIKAVIISAIEGVENEAYRETAYVLLGFRGAAKSAPTPREDDAAKVFGYPYGRSYRRPQASLAKGRKPRSQLDVTFEQVARSMVELERVAVAQREAVSNSVSTIQWELDARSSLQALTAGWSSLPPLFLNELAPLRVAELDEELRKVLAHHYHAFGRLREQKTFVSWASALELRRHHYDPADSVYVLSRRDSTPGFREQEGWSAYVDWLRSRKHAVNMPSIWQDGRPRQDDVAEAPEEGINQIRIAITADRDSAIKSVAEVGALHRTGSLFHFPSDQLGRYEYLRDLRFGLLISTRHRYAMISIPPYTQPQPTGSRDIAHFVDDCHRYEPLEGQMRAVITANADYVRKLIDDFEAMLVSPDAICLPSGFKCPESDGK